MATPLLAMADWARAGLSNRNPDGGGNSDLATAGRSRGAAELKPKDSAPAVSFWAPRSRPIWANAVLQDTAMIWGRGPPQRSPPKFFSVWPPLWGSGSSVNDGYTGDEGVAPPSARSEERRGGEE